LSQTLLYDNFNFVRHSLSFVHILRFCSDNQGVAKRILQVAYKIIVRYWKCWFSEVRRHIPNWKWNILNEYKLEALK
jgi:hypothetical protein